MPVNLDPALRHQTYQKRHHTIAKTIDHRWAIISVPYSPKREEYTLMEIDPKRFRAGERAKIRLADWATKVKPFYKSKDEYKEILGKHTEKLSELQNRLYAQDRYSLLLIFQAMDAAG